MSPSATNYDGVIALIREEIKRRGWKRKDFANALGKSPGWASQIMSQNPKTKTNLSLRALLEIARVLDIHPASLIPYDSESETSSKPRLDDYIRNIVQEEISKYKKEG